MSSLVLSEVNMKTIENDIQFCQSKITFLCCFQVITVENQFLTKEENAQLLSLMAKLGYKELDSYPINPKNTKVIDYLFYHPYYVRNK